jgi:hypothetical protein
LKDNFESNVLDGMSQSLPLNPVNKREKIKMSKMKNEYEHMMKSNSIIMKLDHVEKKV